MDLPDGMGQKLLLRLLGLKRRWFSRSAWLAAITRWRRLPEQPGQAVSGRRFSHADHPASIGETIQELRSRPDSNPVEIFHAIALSEALGNELDQLTDSVWLSQFRQATKALAHQQAGTSRAIPTGVNLGSEPSSATDRESERDGTAGRQERTPGADSQTTDFPDRVSDPGPMSDTSRHPGNTSGRAGDGPDTEQQARDGDPDSQATSDQGWEEGSTTPAAPTGMVGFKSRYRILRPHAQGGLGAVFVAHDEELHREVALKEILERHGHSTEFQLRFLLEAEVTGGLEHPGIVPVYGLGRYEDGRPYYAMRFIRGESLKSAIARFHQAEASGRDPGERALAMRRLLTHFVDVCEAIAYAHSRGVLHRDLKPANVMLGKYGETLVVDWGLAKPLGRCFPEDESTATNVFRTDLDLDGHGEGDGEGTLDASAVELPAVGTRHEDHQTHRERPLIPPSLGKSSETIAGSRIGTPSFMSPEQAAGQIDRMGPASDIYSLGASLYNLLTGRPPFVGTDLLKTLDRVGKGDFPPPRSIKHSTPRALQAIVLKAMALQPDDRYVTAKALSEDIEHWMADEPVAAYRDPWNVRMGRFARRHKTAVAASAALLVAAVLGLTAGSIALERERARTEYERALAVKNYRYAYEAAETMLSHVGDVDLADIPQMEGVRLELLKTARLQFQNLLEQHSHDPEILLLEARTQARLGDVQEMLGLYAEAEQNDRAAIDSLRVLRNRFPDDDRPQHALARASHELGVLLNKMNRFKESETALREALHLREQLASRFPDDPAIKRDLASSRYDLGSLLARLANPRPEDKALYQRAIKDQEELLAAKPGLAENQVKMSQYLNNLAILEGKTEPALAERDFRKLLELMAGLDHTLASLPGARWQIARASNNLGSLVFNERGAYKDAETLLIKARDELLRLTAEFPGILQYRRELASIFNNLGRLGRYREQNELASESFREAATLLKPLATEYPQVPDYQQNLAIDEFQLNLLKFATDPVGADATLTNLLAEQHRLVVRFPEIPHYQYALGHNLFDYAKLLVDRGRAAQAANLVEEALAQFQKALESDPGNRVYIRNVYESLKLQMRIELELRHVERAAGCADELIPVLPGQLSTYLAAAAGLSGCVKLAAEEPLADSHEGHRNAEAYGRRAVELLREAVKLGLLKSSDPLLYEEYVPLRSRTDFQELFQSLPVLQHPVNS